MAESNPNDNVFKSADQREGKNRIRKKQETLPAMANRRSNCLLRLRAGCDRGWNLLKGQLKVPSRPLVLDLIQLADMREVRSHLRGDIERWLLPRE